MDEPEDIYDEEEHCILHLRGTMNADGRLFEGELIFMADHQIFRRSAVDGYSDGWEYTGLWQKIDEIYEKAEKYARSGWRVIWHPEYGPKLKEFTKSVQF